MLKKWPDRSQVDILTNLNSVQNSYRFIKSNRYWYDLQKIIGIFRLE